MRLFVIIGSIAVCLSLAIADLTDELKTLNEPESNVEDLIDAESNEDDTNNVRKRDSGYTYPRPSRFNIGYSFGPPQSFSLKGNSATRLSKPRRRPFSSYGPPNHTRSPHSQKNKYRGSSGFGTQNIRFPSNDQPNKQIQKEIPNPIVNISFQESSPIANQNDVPFRSNSANYLPPRNQKLPIYTQPDIFQQSQPIYPQDNQQTNFDPNFQRQNLIKNPAQSPQISDAAVFLNRNAQKISQLYDTPASNLDYAPNPIDHEKSRTDSRNHNDLRTLDLQTQSENRQNPEGFNIPIPSYSSGILESPRTLERIESLEKDRLISQLRQALTSQTQTTEFLRYAQNYGQSVQNENSLSSIGTQISQLDKPSGFNNNNQNQLGSSYGIGNTAFSQGHLLSDSSLGNGNIPITYGLPIGSQTVTTPSTTTPTTTMPNIHRPHDIASQGTFHPTAGVFPVTHPFPQNTGITPSLISGTNFVASLPNYGTTFVPSSVANIPGQTSGTSPTYFGLPIPNVPESKPSNTGVSSAYPSIPAKPPNTLSHPPISVQHVYPLSPTPVHSILPVIPASSTHPINGIQPSLVNSIFLKPVKPVIPVYYYQNVAYHLQKPSLTAHPWNYAPAYTKFPQNWK